MAVSSTNCEFADPAIAALQQMSSSTGSMGEDGSRSGKGRSRHMLRHAHFYLKGGLQTFAALCIEVSYAGQADH
jgi:hypothetical protein